MPKSHWPSLESLRVFEAVARLESITRAADELGVSKVSVSIRMRDLEAALGAPIFARKRPRLVLSPSGRRLAEQVAEALALVSQGVSDLRAAGPSPDRAACTG